MTARRLAWPSRLPRLPRLRLLPLTIFAAVLMLGVRVGDMWLVLTRGAPVPDVQASHAEAKAEPAAPAAAPAAAPHAPSPEAAGSHAPAPAEHAAAEPAAPAVAPAAGEHAGEHPAAPPSSGGQSFTPSDVEILQRLSERRDALDQRARDLDQREALLQVAEKRLEEKLGELQSMRKQLQDLVGQAKADQQTDYESLVKIYETMKPKEAAAIFDTMDNKVLLNVISRMKESKTASILAAMEPKRAQEVTILLANRKNLPTVPE